MVVAVGQQRPRRAQSPEMTLRQHLIAFLRELAIVVIGALIVSSLLRLFVGQMFDIPSASMSPTLSVSDRVLVEKISDVGRGQVVVFHDPGGWLEHPATEPGPVRAVFEHAGVVPPQSSDHVIKRVIGMPGDRVECCDAHGRLLINGQAVDEGFLGQPASTIRFAVVVPAGHVFVLGDNRARSSDSRCHLHDAGDFAGQNAFVPVDDIVGRAAAVTWPSGHWRGLAPPEVYDAVPSPAGSAPDRPVIEAGADARC